MKKKDKIAELQDAVEWLEKGNAEWRLMYNEQRQRADKAELLLRCALARIRELERGEK